MVKALTELKATAEILSVSRSWLYRQVELAEDLEGLGKEAIPHYRAGSKILFDIDETKGWMKVNGKAK